mgnify:CR=1 FL=1
MPTEELLERDTTPPKTGLSKEDQQQQRLEQSIVDKVKSQGIRAVESIGIPLGMAMQPQQTVKMAPDPITGRRTAGEAGTLANQEMAAHRNKIKRQTADFQEFDTNIAEKKYKGAAKHSREIVDEALKPGTKYAHPHTRSAYDWRWMDVLDRGLEVEEEAWRERDTARRSIQASPAYKKWAIATVGAMESSQELKNLKASASDLLTKVSKAAGGINPHMAMLGMLTGGLMVGYEVLKELGDADDTAIPKTLRFIAQNQEAPLYDYHVAPEAAAQLTPEDIEALFQDGTLSHEFYTQLSASRKEPSMGEIMDKNEDLLPEDESTDLDKE